MASDKVVHLTTENFQDTVNGDKPVLVDFWAEWCGPCRALGPTIDALADRFEGKAVVAKVDVDSQAELGQKFGIQSIPTVLVFKGGEVTEKFVGMRPEDDYANALEGAGASA
ncbi:MAG: thioredoxin [Phycisphaerales bacterium JB040]